MSTVFDDNEKNINKPLQTSLSYAYVAKEFIEDMKQNKRDLQTIMWVFHDQLDQCVKEAELNFIFSYSFDVYNFNVELLNALENVVEMSHGQMSLCVGACILEFAEDFDIYGKYATHITSIEHKNALQNLADQLYAPQLPLPSLLGFKEAVKYYLPKLLLAPIWHAINYFDNIHLLTCLSTSEEDKRDLQRVNKLLNPLEKTLKGIASELPEDYRMPFHRLNNRALHQITVEKTQELFKTVKHFKIRDANSDVYTNFIREDTLKLLTSNNRVIDRKVYLFNGVLFICKPIRCKSIKQNSKSFRYFKEKCVPMRQVKIIDRNDNDDLKYAFEVSPQQNQSIVLIAKSLEHKNGWMADLVMVNTKSMLDRILDSILLDIEKKHPLKLPNPDVYKFAVPDSPENIVLEDKETAAVPLIKGATLCKLIERLTYHIYADPTFVRIFLTIYRSFCTPQNLLQLLIERYDIPEAEEYLVDSYVAINKDRYENKEYHTKKERQNSPHKHLKRFKKEYVKPVQLRVLNVLRHWVDHHFYDFEKNQSLLEDLLRFLEKLNVDSMRKWVESVLKIVQRKQEQEENHKQITFAYGNSPPAIEHHLQVPESEINLLTLHPLELARQLTILEFELYKTVKPSELVGSVWTKRDKEITSPNLLRMIKHTTNFTNWIAKSILDAENFKERVAMLNRAIEVMMVLSELNNFNGVLSVMAAIDSAAIYRLKFTFQRLSERYRNFLEECRELSKDHLRRYQEKLRSINPPCVPFFGMYLTNILHIEEGNSDELPNTELINFSKRRKVAEITGEIQQYQNQPYCLQVDPIIRSFLLENMDPFKGMCDSDIADFLYAESERLEPRDAKQPIKFAKKWPNYHLKSPGIKPKSDSKSKLIAFHFEIKKTKDSKSVVSVNTSEDEQSPMVCDDPTTSSSSVLCSKIPKRYEDKSETKYEGQELVSLRISQIRQACDAPTLLPRNANPAPLIPTRNLKHFAMRMSNVATMNIEQSLHRLCLQLPNSSVIMMRRSLESRSKENKNATSTDDNDPISSSTEYFEKENQ